MNFNITALYFIYKKETLRFLKIYHQTIITPIVNAVLFYSVFTLAFGSRSAFSTGDISFELVIASGLTIMSVLQNAYTNSSSSVAMSKILGHMTDYLIPPINKNDILLAHILACITRGFISAIVVGLSLCWFSGLKIYHPYALLFYTTISCVIFASLGVIIGSMSSSFDKNHAYNTYIISPLTFLSGTFYRINNLPEFWQSVIKLNPVYYMIEGFRYATTNFSDMQSHVYSMFYLVCVAIISYLLALYLLNKHYKVA